MKRKKIVEENLALDNPLVKTLFCQYGWSDRDDIFKMNGTANVVYIESKNPGWVSGTMRIGSSKNSSPHFTELLNAIEKPNFVDYLLLTSFYGMQNKKLQKIISFPSHFGKIESVDSILSVSKGYLAFSFQYELLAQMVLGVGAESARRIRKNFNMKLYGLYDMFPSKTAKALTKIISERILLDDKITINPNWLGAKNLIEVN